MVRRETHKKRKKEKNAKPYLVILEMMKERVNKSSLYSRILSNGREGKCITHGKLERKQNSENETMTDTYFYGNL